MKNNGKSYKKVLKIFNNKRGTMEKKHIISIAGDLASGKGTASKIISEKLNYGIYKNGEFFRKLAKDMNMDVTTFNKYVESHPEIDIQIENSAKEYSKSHDNFIIDARLGWYAVPESFKVYLTVDINEAARRAFEDANRKDTENFKSIEEQKKDLELRFKLENERYFNLYNVRKEDLSNYDLVIDTTNKLPDDIANEIIEKYNKWINTL